MELQRFDKTKDVPKKAAERKPTENSLFPALSHSEVHKACVFHTAYNLSRMGYECRLLSNNRLSNDFSIMLKGKLIAGRVFVIDNSKARWTLPKLSSATHLIVLADIQDDEMYPDVYVLTASEWSSIFGNSRSIDKDEALSKFEEYWFDIDIRNQALVL